MTECRYCEIGISNQQNGLFHCSCLQQRCNCCSFSGLSRCPTCNYFTIDTRMDTDESSDDEDSNMKWTSSSGRYESRNNFKNFDPAPRSGRYESRNDCDPAPLRSKQDVLNQVRMQMQDLKEQEEELLTSMNRRQKKDKAPTPRKIPVEGNTYSFFKGNKKHDNVPSAREIPVESYTYPFFKGTQKRDKISPGKIPVQDDQYAWLKETKMKKVAEPPGALKLECIEGPNKGQAFRLIGAVVIGTNPSKKANHGSYAIEKDSELSPNHVKLVLVTSGSKKKPVLTIKVTDLKSDNGTRINNKLLPKGTSRQAFVRDRIQVGASVFRVLKL